MKKIFFDTEFSRLTASAQIMSIAFVNEQGEYYQGRFDFSEDSLHEWVIENVVPHLPTNEFSLPEAMKIIGDEPVEFWGYAPMYDWVLFCDLFGGALNLPKNIFWIPKDWCALAEKSGLPFDQNPLELFPQNGKYGALEDALALREAVLFYSTNPAR